jgi:hypothetical protein
MQDVKTGEAQALREGMDRLKEILGQEWEVLPLNVVAPVGGNYVADPDTDMDIIWTIRNSTGGGSYGQVLVEATSELTPAVAERVLTPQVNLMRRLHGQVAVLVIAPWLSPRTRTILERRGFGYLDLTGNVSLRLNQPAVMIKTEGAQRNPNPAKPGRRGLSGPQAGRLVRVLVDFKPPYFAKDLAVAAGISEGYVSRLLDTMADEALITREGRVIVEADWVGLLRARAQVYKVLRANHVVPMVARQGRSGVLEGLAHPSMRGQAAVTGPVAAHAVAPTAVGGQLMIYVRPGPHIIDEVAKHLALLRGDPEVGASSDVLLLAPMSESVFDRTEPLEGTPGVERVGLSLLVLDCLGGSGRMPAEGEALLTHMIDNVDAWRTHRVPTSDHSGLA